ncbi:response regulator, partial [Parapusillimonas sp. SGNA-6]|nr:response regulator [Parapusillimonas sp. SGNA-6]
PEITIAKVKSFVQQIHIQEEIIHKNQELELSRKALMQAHEEAEAARKSKEIFLANMSHEIRTPINGIVGIIQMLKSADLNSEHQDWLHRLEMASDSLLLIINDILDISKIDSGKLKIEFEEFNLENLLLDTEKFFRFKALNKKIDFRVDIDSTLPKYVRFDSLRLQQIISNFISNSLKFTDTGEITLSATKLAQQDNRVEIKFTVKDSGIGIKPEVVEKIFQAFEQGDDGITKKFGGTGLGLAIVKRLANLLGGTVHAESEYGRGSQFSFITEMEEISHTEANETQENLAYTQLSKLNDLKILIAEDNDLNSFILSHMLKTWNCDVTIVKNGRLALEALETSDYDVVLMDAHMPIMSGFEAIRQIRTNH